MLEQVLCYIALSTAAGDSAGQALEGVILFFISEQRPTLSRRG